MESYRDIDTIKAVIPYGPSISESADTIEVKFREIEMEVHYWAEPTDECHGVNRPDYDDEISVFTKSDDDQPSRADLADLERQCLEKARAKFIATAGINLSFSSRGL